MGRISGAVIAPGAHGQGAEKMAEAIRAAVNEQDPESDGPTPSASVGWAVFPQDGADFETLVRRADERMMELKRSGRSRCNAEAAIPPAAAPTRARRAAG